MHDPVAQVRCVDGYWESDQYICNKHGFWWPTDRVFCNYLSDDIVDIILYAERLRRTIYGIRNVIETL